MRVIIAREAGVRRERLRQAILGIGLECGAVDCVTYSELASRLLQGPADLVLVGLEAEPATPCPSYARRSRRPGYRYWQPASPPTRSRSCRRSAAAPASTCTRKR